MIKSQQRKGCDDMKKKILMLTAAAALAAMLAGCNQSVQGGKQMNYIGEEAAKNMAVTAAQLKSDDVVFTEAELDEKNGTVYYEVKFTADGTKYSYAIDALTGAVIESGSQQAQGYDPARRRPSRSRSTTRA